MSVRSAVEHGQKRAKLAKQSVPKRADLARHFWRNHRSRNGLRPALRIPVFA